MKTKKRTFGKLALLIFFAITIPAVIQNVVYFVQAETNIREELITKYEESLDDKAGKLTIALNNAHSLAMRYRKNEILNSYLDCEYKSAYDFMVLYQDKMIDLLRDITFYDYKVSQIKLYTTNNSIVSGVYIQYLENGDFVSLDDEPVYLNVSNIMEEQDVSLRVCETGKNRTKMLSDTDVSILCSLDYYDQYSNYKKYLKISLDLEEYKQILCESNLFENMYLTDDAGRVIATAKETGQIKAGLKLSDSNMVDGYPVMKRKINGYPLYLYGVYDVKMISEGFTSSRRIEVGVTLASVVITLALIYPGVFSVKRRVYAIVDQSELAQMELEKETNKAKLLALQSQVNPHFMFNALESIRLKAIIKGERETADMIKYMAKMFRHMIQWENDVISLKEEIAIMEDFLRLQKYRFEDEFTYELTVSDDAWDCLIPRMLLQPLVENASIHGMETSAGARWIRFRAEVEDGFLYAIVEDCGGGIEPQRLSELQRNLSGESSGETKGCVGLANVYRRLKLYYGNDFSFDIDSELDKGTKVTVKIPEVR